MRRRRRRRPKRIWRHFFTLTTLAVIIACVYFFASPGFGEDERALAAAAPPEVNEPVHLPPAEPPDTAPESASPFTVEAHISEVTDTQYLKLVNRERAIAAPVNREKLVSVWPDMPVSTTDVTLHQTTFAAVRELFAAAQSADIDSLFVASGYRSHEHQSRLYENAVDRRYVMTPGHSEHQLGLAADILTSSHNFQTLRGTPEARWLAENAPQFGLILRYPYDKQDITGVAYEPWHFRYVGRVHAWYMGKHDFVLEEYIEYLQAHGGFQTEFSGRSYYVLYQRPENGMILLPDGLNFWVSSANTGGYVVTAWR